jgi:hypothetical protein
LEDPLEKGDEPLLPESGEPSTRSGVAKQKPDEAEEAVEEAVEEGVEEATPPAEVAEDSDAGATTAAVEPEMPIKVMRPPVSPSNTPPIAGLRALDELPLLASPEFLRALDDIRSVVEEDAPLDERELQFVATGVTATGLSLTAGFVTWAIRGGSLLSALMAGIPAWKGFDPLPVVAGARRRKDSELDELSEAAASTDDEEAEVAELFEVQRAPEAEPDGQSCEDTEIERR